MIQRVLSPLIAIAAAISIASAIAWALLVRSGTFDLGSTNAMLTIAAAVFAITLFIGWAVAGLIRRDLRDLAVATRKVVRDPSLRVPVRR